MRRPDAFIDLLDFLFVRTPHDKLVRDWCYAKDDGDLDRVQEIELELEELREAPGTPMTAHAVAVLHVKHSP